SSVSTASEIRAGPVAISGRAFPPGLAATTSGESHANRNPHRAQEKAIIERPMELIKLKGNESVLPGHAKSAIMIVPPNEVAAGRRAAHNRRPASMSSLRHPTSAWEAASPIKNSDAA